MKTLSLVSLALLVPSAAVSAEYQIDAAHTRVGFSVSHMMVSTVHGQFAGVSGAVDYDPADVGATRMNITIDVASVDTRNADRDDHLRNPDFFDVASHPQMTFTSKKVKDLKGPGFDVIGDLTLRGVTKEVVLHVDGLAGPVKDPWGNLKVGGHAWTVLNRQDFGVSWNSTLDQGGVVVGDEVRVDIDVEIARKADDKEG